MRERTAELNLREKRIGLDLHEHGLDLTGDVRVRRPEGDGGERQLSGSDILPTIEQK
jgi:hypothetical protein